MKRSVSCHDMLAMRRRFPGPQVFPVAILGNAGNLVPLKQSIQVRMNFRMQPGRVSDGRLFVGNDGTRYISEVRIDYAAFPAWTNTRGTDSKCMACWIRKQSLMISN